MRRRAGRDDDQFGHLDDALDRHGDRWRGVDDRELEALLTQDFEVGATVDLCERAGKPLIFVVNAATPKAKITYEAAVALSQHGTVAPVTLHHRTDFAASMIDGRTVMEVDPKGKSAQEVTELWDYIADRLEKNFRRTVFAAPGGPQLHAAAPRPAGGFGRRVAGQ